MKLRPYQKKMREDIESAWTDNKNVLAVLPTGGGKTVIFANILKAQTKPSFAIAHRQELVGQISNTLCKFKVPHNIIAPTNLVNFILKDHAAKFGYSSYDPRAVCSVAGVRTLNARKNALKDLTDRAKLWVIDEGHHIQAGNEWGKAVSLFRNARGLAVTATPVRADGGGLGRKYGGYMDVMITGPTTRELINQGYLSDYRVINKPSDIDLSRVKISAATGDWNKNQLRTVTKNSSITGDIVAHYLKYAAGKLGVTFVPSVETAKEVSEKFNRAGVPAEVVTAKTPAGIRNSAVSRFGRRELLQLVNVDIFGEGFDLPALEVISMARSTCSFSLFSQQFGRVLRILAGKKYGMVIDHVGNIALRHGLPDAPRKWSLKSREKRASGQLDRVPVKTCDKCLSVYEVYYRQCPYCSHVNEIVCRDTPAFVDGDLTELSPEVLAAMRGEVSRIDGDFNERCGLTGMALLGARKQHQRRQGAQYLLRLAISYWAGYQRQLDRPDHESYKRFYYSFGIDVLSAQSLGRPAAEKLTVKIWRSIKNGIT